MVEYFFLFSYSLSSFPFRTSLAIYPGTAAAHAAVLIGVRGKQIVLLEWDGMEWNDYAEVSSYHGVFELVLGCRSTYCMMLIANILRCIDIVCNAMS